MNKEIKSLVNVSSDDKNIDKYIEDTSLMNDIRFRATLNNNTELASFILNIVLKKKDLVVDKIKTQESIDLIDNKSIVLDAHAIDSNNVHYENKHFYKNKENRIKFLNKCLSRKKKGSKNRNKIRIKLAKIHEKIVNQRNTYLHQITSKIVNENQVICIEDLNVKGML